MITSVGIDARTRAALRTTLHDKRFGELREGVWLRPDNLDTALGEDVAERVRVLHTRDDDPAELAASCGTCRVGCASAVSCSTKWPRPPMFPAGSSAAAMVRHLLTDPVLPDELLPDDWPGAALREAYNDFAAELVARRDDDRTDGGDMTVGGGDAGRERTSGPVTTVIMNRPEARNAVNGPAAAGLYAAFDEFDKDDSAAVAVLWGDNGTFCAGADLKAFGTPDANPVHRTGPGPMGPSRMVLSKPVIAAVSGYAVAGGLELALWCDMRVVEEDAIMGVFCRRWGVPLIDGGTVRLPRLIGHSRAMDMILTGRGVDAAEALAMGLANRVVPKGQARQRAEELAAELAALPQQCMRSDRLSMLNQWGMSEAEAMDFEFASMSRVAAESLEGAARFAAAQAGTGRALNSRGCANWRSSVSAGPRSRRKGSQPLLILLFEPVSLTFGSPSL